MNLHTISGHTFDADGLPDQCTILDVGCREFAFTKGIRALRPRAVVYALDPDPAIHFPRDMPVAFMRKALVHDDRRKSKYASYSTGEGNFLTDLDQWHDAKIIEVPCINIVDLMRFECCPRNWDLVKLDCEGSEFKILECWPGPIARQISVEFHDYNQRQVYNDAYYENLFAALATHGYKVVQHELSDISGRGAVGHWDSLLVLEA